MKRFLLLPALLAMLQLQAQQIEEYRYWINDDPTGLTATGIGPAQQVVLNAALTLPTLTKDFNTITIQFKDTNDVYSVPVSGIFTRNTGDVVGYEYWIDDDIANRVSGTMTAGSTVNLTSNIPLCLVAGTHVFAIRFSSASGTWSVPITRQFTSTASPDTDGDGICDALDPCPLLANLVPGNACDDGNPNTDNDIVNMNCLCVGTLADEDCEGVPGGPAQPGTPCNDNDICTMNDVYEANCNCAGTFADADSDGVCDANDLCPGTPGGEGVNSTGCACSQSVVDDGDACTVDQCVNGTITHTYQDTDGDGTCDASDGCATDANKTSPGTCGCGNPEPGATCNDGNPNTENDIIGSNCTCAGTPVTNSCTTDLALSFTKDATSQVDWYIHEQGTNIIVQQGSLTPGASTEEVSTCVPDGCYYLRVTDDAGNGISGGYILRTSGTGSRIIDNAANFNSGSTSQVAAGEGFCIPLGVDRLLGGSCDKFDWRNDEYVVATDNPSVTAVWNNFPSGSSQRANSGYEMWWYDPNGGYSFRRFQSHATTNGMTANAVRACHFRINSWSGNQLQATVLYNVKVRSRVLGTNSAWGPACRFVLDPARAQCPLTKLTDQAGQFFSCGATRNIGTSQSNLVHAQIAKKWVNNAWVNANRYQFRFTTDGGGSVITKTGNGNQYFVNTSGLQPCKTYQVDVRASFDGGATWCTAYPAVNPYAPNWGPLCQLYTTGCPSNTGGGNQNVAIEGNADEMNLFPNPNNGEQLTLLLNGMDATVRVVGVEIFDTFGKRVVARTFAVNDASMTANVRLNGELAAGMYVVNVVAGERTWTERLLIQP